MDTPIRLEALLPPRWKPLFRTVRKVLKTWELPAHNCQFYGAIEWLVLHADLVNAMFDDVGLQFVSTRLRTVHEEGATSGDETHAIEYLAIRGVTVCGLTLVAVWDERPYWADLWPLSRVQVHRSNQNGHLSLGKVGVKRFRWVNHVIPTTIYRIEPRALVNSIQKGTKP